MNESKVQFDGESLPQQLPGDSWMELVAHGGNRHPPPMQEAPESAVLGVSCEVALGDTTMNFEPQH